MSNKKGLGKGFDALLPSNFDSSILAESGQQIHNLELSLLSANPEQPRRHFDSAALEGLALSIKEHGILQPLVVTPHDKKYYVIAGERRWRAAKLAGLERAPAIVRTAKQLERLELALVENVQRVDLSPLEQAASIQYLHEQFSQEYSVIAKRLGKAVTTLHNMVRLLQLPEAAKDSLAKQKISEGHARAILALKDEKQQLELLRLIENNAWTVRHAERYVTAHKQGVKGSKNAQKRVATTNQQTEKLATFLKVPVSLRRMAKGGKLEIGFKNETELKRLVEKLTRKN